MFILHVYGLCLIASVSSQNDVRLPPSITKSPNSTVIFKVFDPITLACRAEGTPPMTFEWRQNGKRRYITINSTFTLHEVYIGDLSIINATTRDDGFYQCFATNLYGTALSTVAHVQQAFIQGSSQSYANITVQEGHPFVIQAARRNSFPTPTYHWETANGTVDQNPMKYQLSRRVRDTWGGDLHFAYALKEDELYGKLYKSTTYNAVKTARSGGNYTRVMVTKGSGTLADFPPNITYFAKSQEVALIGCDIELKCFFSGNPLPNITWSRSGNNLSSGRYSIPSSEHGTLLIISNITESDEGDYVCAANNSMGTANHTLNIRVEAVPIFKQESDIPRNVNVTEGDSITFNCFACAKPEATIIWLRNGHQLDVTNVPARFAFSNNKRSLTIRNVCRDCCVDRDRKTDLMVIQCNASNVHGYDFAQGYLNVLSNGSSSRKCPEGNDTQVNRSLSHCNGCSGNERRDLRTTHADDHALNETMAAEITSSLPALTSNIESLRHGNLNTSITIKTQGMDTLDSTTEGDTTDTVEEGGFSKAMVAESTSPLPAWTTINSESLSPENPSTSIEKQDIHVYSTTLEEVTEYSLNEADIASQLSALTNKNEDLSPGNLNASIMIINKLPDLLRNSNITLNETVTKSIVQAVSSILQPNNADAWKKLIEANKTAATVILPLLDACGQILFRPNIPGRDSVGLHTDNIVLESWSFEKSNSPIQIEFPNGTVWGENSGDRISISMEALKGSISPESGTSLSMWGVYYRTIHDYLPGKNDSDDVINSRIMSFSIDGLNSSATLKPPVTITLRHNQYKRMSFRRTCAFWNFDKGDWDSAGCLVTSTNSSHTICNCDHLTNFAILMSRNPKYDDTLLSLLSIIGCSISVAALILTIIVYALTWKHAKSSQAILLNLCIALIIVYIIFVAGADKFDFTVYSKVGCTVVAALLHYFLLVAFFIMLAEGIDMVLYIFFVFHIRRTRETIMLIASAWVLPLIIVGVSLGVTRLEGYGHEKACWLSGKNGLIWAFIGPVMCIIAINLVILIIILRLISQKKALIAKNARKRDEIRATIWNLSVMCPVLGLGWLFGVFSVSFDHPVFQYVFVIANSLHGLLIFVIYALFHNKTMNEKICAVYSKYIGRCGKTDKSVSTKLTSSQDQSTSSTGHTRLTSAQHSLLGSKEDIN